MGLPETVGRKIACLGGVAWLDFDSPFAFLPGWWVVGLLRSAAK